MQPNAVQTSDEQITPSLQAALLGVPTQAPAPLQASVVQATPSLPPGCGPDSKWHVDEQQSPLTALPSSHCSPPSTAELPHSGMSLISTSLKGPIRPPLLTSVCAPELAFTRTTEPLPPKLTTMSDPDS